MPGTYAPFCWSAWPEMYWTPLLGALSAQGIWCEGSQPSWTWLAPQSVGLAPTGFQTHGQATPTAGAVEPAEGAAGTGVGAAWTWPAMVSGSAASAGTRPS